MKENEAKLCPQPTYSNASTAASRGVSTVIERWRLAAFDGSLYFSADDGTRGRALWRSDGTAAGTTRVRDIFR